MSHSSKRQARPLTYQEALPFDVWSYILVKFLPDWQGPCRLVCRQWRDIIGKGPRKIDVIRAIATAIKYEGTLNWLLDEVYSAPRPMLDFMFDQVVVWAAHNGWLSVLKWVYNKNESETRLGVASPRMGTLLSDPELCAAAAIGGQMEALQYLRLCKCPWDWRTIYLAKCMNHDAIAKWAEANGCPKESVDGEYVWQSQVDDGQSWNVYFSPDELIEGYKHPSHCVEGLVSELTFRGCSKIHI